MNETIYKDQETSGLEENEIGMSEKVQLLASGIYREFEKLIQKYDSPVVKDLMPLVVSVLENLDELEKLRRSNEVELQLFKEDNSALMGQYEREKTTRKTLEDKLINLEYSFEDEKKNLNGKIENLESSLRLSDLKVRNCTDSLSRMEEKEKDQKLEYQKLYERYTEVLKGYADQMERHKGSQSNTGTLQHGASMTKSSVSQHKLYVDSQEDELVKSQMKKYDSGSNYDLELLEETLTNNMREEELVPECIADIMDADGTPRGTSKQIESDLNVDDEHDEHFDTEIYADDDSEFGFGKEIENLIKENTELVETKNALNVVKDDLIKKLDLVNGENAMLKSDMEILHNRELDMKARISNLENDYKEIRQQNESLKHTLENVDESKDNKRFTRVEIAILLKERNHYKERLLELEDTLRYTEMVRASKQHPELVFDQKSKLKQGDTGISVGSTIMDRFRSLMKTIDDVTISNEDERSARDSTSQSSRPRELSATRSSSMTSDMASSSSSGAVLRSKKSHFSQNKPLHKKNFVFKEDNSTRSQLYGWSVSKELSQSSVACHVPTPVASHSILEAKDTIVCVTKSADTDESYSPFLWVIVERPTKDTNSYYLAQFFLAGYNEITANSISYLKILRRPCSIMALPELNKVIEDRYSYAIDDFPSPAQSPGVDQTGSMSMSEYVKVSKVHNTKAKLKQRGNHQDSAHAKTIWISFDDGTVVIYYITSSNVFDGRIATIFLPGPVSCMKYFQGRIFMAQTDGCLSVFDLKSTNESWEYNQCLVVEMSHNSPITALAEHRSTGTVWFGSDQYCYVIGAGKLGFKKSFQVSDKNSQEQHISRIECIYGTNSSTIMSGQSDLMWVSMSQIGRLYAFDSYSHQRTISIDLRECLSSIIESIDTNSKFRFSFPIIMEDKERLWLGSDCGFIACLSKQAIILLLNDSGDCGLSEEEFKLVLDKNVYVSCHGFSGTLVNILSIPTPTKSCSSTSTPNSNNSLSPTNQPVAKSNASTPSTHIAPVNPLAPSVVIALGSSYVNLNSSPSKVSIDDYINRNNVLIWKV